MTGVEVIALAGSTSLLAGWRLYLVTFVTGFAMRLGWIDLPEKLTALDVLANPWVLVLSGAAALFEFFADKIAFIDSLWDGINTAIRPLGGALLALAIVDPGDPVWQVSAFLLGGGAAFLSHSGKAATRAIVNTSPEPVSNMVVSTGEDIATAGLLALAIANPVAAAIIALVLVLASLGLILAARRLVSRVLNRS
nr:DUF4126 domain-containing protein [uncultured Sphingomonas sp.]